MEVKNPTLRPAVCFTILYAVAAVRYGYRLSPDRPACLPSFIVSYTYAFVGLTPSERVLLESVFALGADEDDDRLKRVRKAQDADLLLVNGDDRAVVHNLRQANQRAMIVLIGRPPGVQPVTFPVLHRPLDVDEVVHVLGALEWPEDQRPPSEADEFLRTFAPSTAFAGGHHTSTPTSGSKPSELPPSANSLLIDSWPPSRADAQPEADIMVLVGPLGGKKHTLALGLRKLGFRVRMIEGSDLGRQLLNLPLAPFVFLDQSSLGDQWLPLARSLGALGPKPDAPPHIVVVSKRSGVINRLRVRMAGCIWMHAPLDRERLKSFFGRRGLFPK
jgi:hypothetical protein